jgi:predicted Zn-dependent protease with MMP-like domain
VALSGGHDWHGRRAPSLDEFVVLARRALDELPQPFRDMVADVPFTVADFATDEVLDSLGIENEFDLLGLFHGVGIPQRGGHVFSGQMPNQIFLYRRPILDYWAEHDDTLGAVITHVLVHEIGHHFGYSDEEMEAIDEGKV